MRLLLRIIESSNLIISRILPSSNDVVLFCSCILVGVRIIAIPTHNIMFLAAAES